MSKKVNLRKVIVPCRFSYLFCFKPNFTNEADAKYSVSAIIPKSDTKTIELITSAIEEAKKEHIGKWGGVIPINLRMPLRDGDVERPEDDAYKNSYFINASSKQRPEVVDKNVNPISDSSEIYSGCYGRISLIFYGYKSGGNVGIGAALGNIQKIKDGDYLGNRASAVDEFEIVEEELFIN